MRRGLALGLLLGWLLGVATAVLGLLVAGGWYDHRIPTGRGEYERLVEGYRCEPVWTPERLSHLRCPRLRLP